MTDIEKKWLAMPSQCPTCGGVVQQQGPYDSEEEHVKHIVDLRCMSCQSGATVFVSASGPELDFVVIDEEAKD